MIQTAEERSHSFLKNIWTVLAFPSDAEAIREPSGAVTSWTHPSDVKFSGVLNWLGCAASMAPFVVPAVVVVSERRLFDLQVLSQIMTIFAVAVGTGPHTAILKPCESDIFVVSTPSLLLFASSCQDSQTNGAAVVIFDRGWIVHLLFR